MGKYEPEQTPYLEIFCATPEKSSATLEKTARVFHINSSKYFYIIISVFLQTQFLHLTMDLFLLFLF